MKTHTHTHTVKWWFTVPFISLLTNLDHNSLHVTLYIHQLQHSFYLLIFYNLSIRYSFHCEFNENYMNFVNVDWFQHIIIVTVFLFLPPCASVGLFKKIYISWLSLTYSNKIITHQTFTVNENIKHSLLIFYVILFGLGDDFDFHYEDCCFILTLYL